MPDKKICAVCNKEFGEEVMGEVRDKVCGSCRECPACGNPGSGWMHFLEFTEDLSKASCPVCKCSWTIEQLKLFVGHRHGGRIPIDSIDRAFIGKNIKIQIVAEGPGHRSAGKVVLSNIAGFLAIENEDGITYFNINSITSLSIHDE